MKTEKSIFAILLALSFLRTDLALARPEYAAKEKLSCSACHDTVWGGGPRTVLGKVYGTRGGEGSQSINTDLYYGDLRAISYWPFKATSHSNSGIAEMEAALTANVPAIQKDGYEVRGVVTYNISPLAGTQLREGYARIATDSDTVTPHYWTIGHFYVPFGLLTDEHRTYVRLQTGMTLNDYDTGAVYSHDLLSDMHLDLGVVNDFQGLGTFSDQKITAGVVGNFRWNPKLLPFLLGTSVAYERISTQPEPYAVSLYGVLSLDRMNEQKHTGSILLESVYAKNWNNPAVNSGGINPGLPQFFSVNYVQSPNLLTSASFGNAGTFKWDISRVWQVFYKLDILSLNLSQLGQVYSRQGLGFEWRLNPNMILNSRFEYATYPNDQTSLPPFEGKESDFFAMLRLWF